MSLSSNILILSLLILHHPFKVLLFFLIIKTLMPLYHYHSSTKVLSYLPFPSSLKYFKKLLFPTASFYSFSFISSSSLWERAIKYSYSSFLILTNSFLSSKTLVVPSFFDKTPKEIKPEKAIMAITQKYVLKPFHTFHKYNNIIINKYSTSKYTEICSNKNFLPNLVILATIIEKRTLITAIVTVIFKKTSASVAINKDIITNKIDTKIKDNETKGKIVFVLV